MGSYAKGIFVPKHPEKYLGKRNIVFRSSWELAVFNFCDSHPSILNWASESIVIPYRNPLTGNPARYIPDLLIVYLDAEGKQHCEVVEIKPLSQTGAKKVKKAHEMAEISKNHAKWGAAQAYCSKQGFVFRILTETSIFHQGGTIK